MSTHTCIHGALLVLFGAAMLGCATNTEMTNQLRSAQAELRELKKDRAMSREKIESLYTHIEELQNRELDLMGQRNAVNEAHAELKREVSGLRSSQRTLKEDLARMQAWTRQLVRGYGPGIWISDPDNNPLFLKKPNKATVRGIIEELNDIFEGHHNPKLIFKKTENRVVHLAVRDGMRLTEGMGSSGAAGYMQTVIYSLGSLPEIDCVHFEFEEGSHASPGKYCR